jgi:hypothetical protein
MSNITSLIRIFSHKHHLVSLFTFANPTVVESFKAPISFLLRASATCHSIIREKKKTELLKTQRSYIDQTDKQGFSYALPCVYAIKKRKEKRGIWWDYNYMSMHT